MTLAPILLFTYNRPHHTRQTLNALLKNKLSSQSELFLFSDGHKGEEDKNEVMEVRRLIHAVKGFKRIHIIEQSANQGLAKSIIDGVTQVIETHGKVIVMEDDLITSPHFLTFMNEALAQFKEEERVGHVHGYCYPMPDMPDAFLIKWVGSWGWGTWERAWRQFNPDGKALLNEIEQRGLAKQFDFNGKYPYTRMLRRQVKGQNNSWAIRWNASLFLNDVLSVNAGKSLVQNIGFDGSGTHSGDQEIYSTHLHSEPLSLHLHPIEEDATVRKRIEQYHQKTYSFRAKAVRRLKKIFGKNSSC